MLDKALWVEDPGFLGFFNPRCFIRQSLIKPIKFLRGSGGNFFKSFPREMIRFAMPSILAISGFSQSGKTTLLSKVLQILNARGLRIGVVKHHGHGARGEEDSINPRGKDSHVLLEAGARAVVLTMSGQEAVYRLSAGDQGPRAAAASLPPVDLVLAEGFKGWPGFKLEVVAPGKESGLRDDPLLLGIVSEEKGRPAGVRWFDRNDAEGVAGFVMECFLPAGRPGPAPDREECLGLWARYEMRPNIMVHSLIVAQAACFLAAALVRSGRVLDLPLTEAGALLHDIAKTECLGRRCDHAERGREILEGLGLPGLGLIVADHIDPARVVEKRGLVSPSTVVNYADKRVRHDRIAALEERIADLVERYGTEPEHKERIRRMGRRSRELEEALFKGLDIRPDDLFGINRLFAGPAGEER